MQVDPSISRLVSDYQLDIVNDLKITGSTAQTTQQIEQINNILVEKGESIDQKFKQIVYNLIVKGAGFVGLDLGTSGRELININVLDTWTARFTKADTPELGQHFQLAQLQNNKIVPLDPDYNLYKGINMGDGPYGRSPLLSIIFSEVYILNFLKILRAGIVTQLQPVRQFSINEDDINKITHIKNIQERTAYINALIGEFRDLLNKLEPNESLIVPSSIQYDGLVGGINKTTLDIETIVRVLERMTIRGGGTFPY